MRSPDQGESWEPVEPTLHNDVHEVATSSCNPKRAHFPVLEEKRCRQSLLDTNRSLEPTEIT